MRLTAVKKYLHQMPKMNEKLQDIVKLATQITGVPIAFITLLEEDIQWIAVRHGYEVEQIPRHNSFCSYAIEQDEIMVVPDTHLDARFLNSPLVINAPLVRYYAGVALKTSEGYNVGTLCVLDTITHQLSPEQLNALEALARQVTNVLELSISVEYLRQTIEQIEEQNTALKKIAHLQSHEIREPLTSVMGIANLLKEDNNLNKREYLKYLETAVNRLDEKIRTIVSLSINASSLN